MSRGSNLKRKQKRSKPAAPKSKAKAISDEAVSTKAPVELSSQLPRLIVGGAGGGKAVVVHEEVLLAKERLAEFIRENKVAYEEMLLEFEDEGVDFDEFVKSRKEEEEAPPWGWARNQMDHEAALESISKRDLSSLIHTQIERIEQDSPFMTIAAITLPTSGGESCVDMEIYSGLLTEAEVVARIFCQDPDWWSSADNIVISHLRHIKIS